MGKQKSYSIILIIHTVLWISALLLTFIGITGINFAFHLAGYSFITYGILMYATYIYFKKAPVLWLSEGKGSLTIILTIFQGSLALFAGIYILIVVS